jgi:hypothetical protein
MKILERGVPLTHGPHTSMFLESLMNVATISCKQDSFSFLISDLKCGLVFLPHATSK